MALNCRDIEAQLTVLSADDGGRKGPVFSGYRVQFFYDGENWDSMCAFPDDLETLYPGKTATVYFCFTRPEIHFGRLKVGKEFQLREGARVVAKGKVTAILDLGDSAIRKIGNNE